MSEDKSFDANESATAWFAVLEAALDRGDVERAAQARRELERLGVRVRFERLMLARRKSREGESHAR